MCEGRTGTPLDPQRVCSTRSAGGCARRPRTSFRSVSTVRAAHRARSTRRRRPSGARSAAPRPCRSRCFDNADRLDDNDYDVIDARDDNDYDDVWWDRGRRNPADEARASEGAGEAGEGRARDGVQRPEQSERAAVHRLPGLAAGSDRLSDAGRGIGSTKAPELAMLVRAQSVGEELRVLLWRSAPCGRLPESLDRRNSP